MRGTVLKLKSSSYDCSSAEDDSEEESQSNEYGCEKKNSLSTSQRLKEIESATPDVNKNILLSNLELHRSSSSAPTKTNIPSNNSAPFQRPMFDWNDDSMWRAMSRHPLFSKYMELQSQLNALFEEIRLDCKKAACEKAFSSLLKESCNSPIETTTVILEPTPQPMDSPPKKRGRPLKRRPGRPRKYPSTNSDPDWRECMNYSAGTPVKHSRKSRDELFLARKPSWICQNCAKQFSSAGWLDRHRSVCSFSKSHQMDSPSASQNQDESATPDLNGMSNGSSTSDDCFERTQPESKSSDILQSSPRLSLSAPCQNQNHNILVGPLQPKMENHNGTDDDEALNKLSYDEEPQCIDEESSVVFCEKCKLEFSDQELLMEHWQAQPDCKLYSSHHGSDNDSDNYSSDSSSMKVSACKQCGKQFRRHKLLKRHQHMCHPNSNKKLWQCIHCFKAFSRQLHHEQHEKECAAKGKHFGREVQRCENCSLLFPTQKKLLKHQAICCPDSNNHMIKLLKCLKCSLVFPSYKKQLKHRAVCCPDSDTDAMVCCHCSKVLIMPDRMAAHKKKCFKTLKKFK